MNFKELQEANKSIKTIGIERYNKKTGQTTVTQYAEVNQRIKAFRMLYPEGFIRTNLELLRDGVCVIKAEVGYCDTNVQTMESIEYVLGTGIACEKENSSTINRTSYVENCETSAIGRALGMMGIGIDTAVASYEETVAAEGQEIITYKEAAVLRKVLTENQIEWVTKRYGKEIEKLTKEEHGEIMRQVNERKATDESTSPSC